MSTRLDRLLLLLSTGSSPIIRQTAAQQLGSIAAQRIARPHHVAAQLGEVYHGVDGEWAEVIGLLRKVLPFLKHKSWETRSAAALAIGYIVGAVGVWEPPNYDAGLVEAVTAAAPRALHDFDVAQILDTESSLLASSGQGFDAKAQTRNGAAKQDILTTLDLNMPGAGTTDLGLDIDAELSGPSLNAGSSVSIESTPAPSGEDLSNLSARERSMLKRKRKSGKSVNGNSAPPPAKVRLVESQPPSTSSSKAGTPVPVPTPPVKTEEDDQYLAVGSGGQVEPKAEAVDEDLPLEPIAVGESWPFDSITSRLQANLGSAAWEVRHGAALGLREILKSQGAAAGMHIDATVNRNPESHADWVEGMASAILRVLVLDRFGDFLGDQVVAPVRETAAQALATVLSVMPKSSLTSVLRIIGEMVSQPSRQQSPSVPSSRKAYYWEVRHAGLIALRYVVTARRSDLVGPSVLSAPSRPDMPLAENQILQDVLNTALIGICDKDDDIRGAAAASLLPISHEIIERLPKPSLVQLLTSLIRTLHDLQDDLSNSVGSVLDLLSSLLGHNEVLHLFQEAESQLSFAILIPAIHPFFRHTLSSVRSAVIAAMNTLLNLEHTKVSAWLDGRLMRLLYQNLIAEQESAIRMSTAEAWSSAVSHVKSPDGTTASLATSILNCVAGWLDILMTPVGQPVNTVQFWKPSSHSPNSSGYYSIDRAILTQDMGLITPEQTLQGRLAACRALAELAAAWPSSQGNAVPYELIKTYLTSASSHQIAFACYLATDICKVASLNSEPAAALVRNLGPTIRSALEAEAAVSYSETVGLLGQIYVNCQQLHGIFRSKGKVPANRMVPLEAAAAFSIQSARRIVGTEFTDLSAMMKPQARSVASPLLQELQQKISLETDRLEIIKESMDVQVFAALAAASIALQVLPTKLNPLIRSLMNGLKFERNANLQARSACAIVDFMQHCKQPGVQTKSDPSDKIINNVASFLVQDSTITPLFSKTRNIKEAFLIPEAVLAGRGQAEEAGATLEVEKARLARRGALSVVQTLVVRYGESLLEALPRLWACMAEQLNAISSHTQPQQLDAQLAANNEIGQDLLDSMTVLAAIMPYLPKALNARVIPLVRPLAVALQSCYTVVRHVAARCLACLCATMPEEAMLFIVEEVMPGMSDPHSPSRRAGVIELVSGLTRELDVRIIPYAVFLVVPLLGRMSDPDEAIRSLATSTFAVLIKLMPLEAGLPDPIGFPEELLKQRIAERDFLAQLVGGGKVATYTLPIKVNVELRNYQRDGISWLAFLAKYKLHGILCDDMGLGKTIQSICILASMAHERAAKQAEHPSPETIHLPSLVVCPPTLTGHWQYEIQKYAPNMSSVIHGGDKQERISRIPALGNFDVVIASYDTVRSDIDSLKHVAWHYCILDEGHIIKNAKTKLSMALKAIRAEQRLILSGTPIQNNVLELWSLFDFLMPGFLGTEESFNKRFSKPIQRSRNAKSSSKEQEAGALALESLHKQVLPFLLRRLKEDVLSDLPPKIIQDYYCDLSPLQQDLYEEYGQTGETAADGVADTGAPTHVFQTLQHLKKLVNHPSLVLEPENPKHQAILVKNRIKDPSSDLRGIEQAPKLLALRQLLQDNGIGADIPKPDTKSEDDVLEATISPHRVLIFCQTKIMLDMIEELLFRVYMPAVSYMRMDGSTPASKRHSVVQTFNADPSIDVLLLTTHVGGLGLNLTSADTVVFVEHDWNPMKDLQAMDRAHRLGQKRVVNVYRLITRGTLEEKIMGLQRFKLDVASTVVSQQNADVNTLDTESVLDLFTLGPSNEEDAAAKKAATGRLTQKALLDSLVDMEDTEEQYAEMRRAAQ